MKLKHPKLPGRVIDVPDEAAHVHKKSGWTEAPKGAEVTVDSGAPEALRAGGTPPPDNP